MTQTLSDPAAIDAALGILLISAQTASRRERTTDALIAILVDARAWQLAYALGHVPDVDHKPVELARAILEEGAL